LDVTCSVNAGMYLPPRREGSATRVYGYHDVSLSLTPGGIAVIAADASFIALVTIWTSLRFYSRRTMGFGLMVEDYFHLCALV